MPAIPMAALLAGSVLLVASTQIAWASATAASMRTGAMASAVAATSVMPETSAPPYPANIEFDPGAYGTYNQSALSNPNIDAVDINLNWYQVEPEPGVFNFAPADQEVAAWVSAGKKVTLELRFQHEADVRATSCSSDGWLPAWEVSRAPTLCEKSSATDLVIPDYFSHAFEKDWRKYVAAVATHFADGAYAGDITYARVALGLGAESFPLEPCYNAAHACSATTYRAAVRKLQTWGYTASSWLKWQESLLSYYKRELAFTTVIYPVNQMLIPASNRLNIDPATGNPIQMDVAEWAAAHGIGIGQEGLNSTYSKDYAKFNEIDAYVVQHDPSTYIQFQTVYAVSDKGTSTCSATCLVQADVQAAEHYHARSIEWYAADDTNTSFQPSFAAWQQFVNP